MDVTIELLGARSGSLGARPRPACRRAACKASYTAHTVARPGDVIDLRAPDRRAWPLSPASRPFGPLQRRSVWASASGDGVGEGKEDGELDAANDVLAPWGAWVATKVMLKYAALSVTLGFLALPAFSGLLGVPVSELSLRGKAYGTLALQLVEGALVFGVVGGAVAPFEDVIWPKFDWGDGRAWGYGGGGAVAATAGVSALSALAAAGAGGGGEAAATAPLRTILGGGDPLVAASLVASGVVVAPFIEECVYRGFLLPTVRRYAPAPVAVMATAAVFAALHLSPQDFPRLAVLGVVLGAAAEGAEGNLVAPLVAHAGYNGIIYAALLLGV